MVIRVELAVIIVLLVLILLALVRQRAPHSARGFRIKQLTGDKEMAITGIVAGATGTFTEVPAPAGSALQAGDVPKWAADDTTITVTASADGTSATAAVPASHAPTSFNLTVSGIASDGTSISTSVAVPIHPPAVVPAKGFTIDQTA